MSERTHTPGRLKVFLGYAAGVGKTYRMLEEVRTLREAGRDAVIGYFESHGRAATIALAEGLELIPRQRVLYRGHEFEEMDREAILRRSPEVCAVDEFPHSNVPGTGCAKRWEDVLLLIEAGIDVLTTMNIQHLESLNDRVREISGIAVRETIPDWVLKDATEVVLIDLPPPALLHRLERGVVYGESKARQALDNFFREPTLAALRELAIRQTAQAVDARQPAAGNSPEPAPTPGTAERILVLIDATSASSALIRRARRVADSLKADCLAVCFPVHGGPPAQRQALEAHIELARRLRIETSQLPPGPIAEQVVGFARRHGVTQVLLNRSPRRRSLASWCKPLEMTVIEQAKDMQVTVVAMREPAKPCH